MLISESIKITLTHTNINWFRLKGYSIDQDTKWKSNFVVKVLDLPSNSNIKISIQCDYCNKIVSTTFQMYLRGKQYNHNKKDCCKKCEPLKRVERSLKRYNFHEKDISDCIAFLLDNKLKQISAIYGIRNKISNKIYIGSTKRLIKRFSYHLDSLLIDDHYSLEMQKDFNTYGWESFESVILELVKDSSTLLQKEQKYADLYISYDIKYGYNQRKDVNKNTGIKMKDHVKSKISAANKGRKLTEQHKMNISNGLKQKSKVPRILSIQN